MPQSQTTVSRVRPGLFIAIFLCLLSLYLATYSGRIESSDSLQVMDAASSLVNFRDLLLDEALWQQPPRTFNLQDDFAYSPYNTQESFIAYFAAAFYQLAEWLPFLGQVHGVWLLNVVVIALTGAVLYAWVQSHGYDARVAILSALIFGVGTIAWAYSKTLFRDPLIGLLLLLIVMCLDIWRKNRLHLWWVILAGVIFIVAYYVKNSTMIALPALIIWILPDIALSKEVKQAIDSIFVIGLLALGIVAFNQAAFDLIAQTLTPLLSINTDVARHALHSYLFSIGGSLWGTSPILLLGIVGGWLYIRENQRRIVWACVTLIVGYAVGHALLTDIHWFGGLSLPPRFLVPTLPFAVILAIPVIDLMFKKRNAILIMIVFILMLLSVIIQGVFSVSLIDAYVQLLPEASRGLVEWLPGLNQFEYLRWRLLPQSWDSLGWDIAWGRINQNWLSIGFVLIAISTMIAVIWEKRRLIVLSLSSITFCVLTAFAFGQLYEEDTLYWAQKEALFEVLSIVENEADTPVPLFLAGSADVTYERFIMNYSTSDTIRPVVIGFQPGERTSERDQPAIVSDFNPDRMSVTMMRIIDHTIAFQDEFWWLAHNSIFTPWALRVEERYFTENYYLLNEYRPDDPTVRLLRFSSVAAPDRQDFRLPQYRSSLRFGDDIALTGYTLPRGTDYQAGDVLPITLYWQTDAPIPTNYTVSWFAVHSDDPFTVVPGFDSLPDGGFAPTVTWQIDDTIVDNRALVLPTDVPTGTYQLWVRLYQTDSGGAIQLPITGGDTYEETTAILPIQIEVVQSD